MPKPSTNPPIGIDHQLRKVRGRWFLKFRLLTNNPPREPGFKSVHLGTHDWNTARERRNDFLARLLHDGREVA